MYFLYSFDLHSSTLTNGSVVGDNRSNFTGILAHAPSKAIQVAPVKSGVKKPPPYSDT